MDSFHSLVRQAVAIVGSQSRLAAMIGTSQQLVSQLCSTARSISGEHAAAIHRATEGRVPCWALRPDLWPEGAEPPAGPPVRALAEAAA